MRTWIVMVLLALSIGLEWNQSDATQDHYCKAVIKENAMEFSFPLPDRRTFEWYQNKTPANQLEYAWQIALEGVDPKYKYELGIYLFRFPDYKPRQGDIETLISNAQVSVFHYGSARVDGQMKAESGIENHELIVRVTDKNTISELMSNRPTAAHFRVYTPYPELNFVISAPLVVENSNN